ncbi:MAG TPA: hypothetical protein DCK98_06230 [Chloroflexi bacterium]|nr:hypothetical protein [Chloroflexota bacterium]HAL27016.1 hypothetical protein [Chloroflexota bacterium]
MVVAVVVGVIAGVDSFTSTSSDGHSFVVVFFFFKSDRDVNVASTDVRSRLDLRRATVPFDAQNP